METNLTGERIGKWESEIEEKWELEGVLERSLESHHLQFVKRKDLGSVCGHDYVEVCGGGMYIKGLRKWQPQKYYPLLWFSKRISEPEIGTTEKKEKVFLISSYSTGIPTFSISIRRKKGEKRYEGSVDKSTPFHANWLLDQGIKLIDKEKYYRIRIKDIKSFIGVYLNYALPIIRDAFVKRNVSFF